jgi:HEAT repeat protein
MSDNLEKIPLDARLLSDAIIELNISRRNVSIYPRNHPSVEKSLTRAFEFLHKLFELRPEITIAVAKDTLIIDDYYLEKKNPVYREFALHLSNLNIAYVTFITGLTNEELYEFHRFISVNAGDSSADILQEQFRELNLIHIRTGFIDYGAFTFEEGKTRKETPNEQLWERYVYGLLEGTLQTEEMSDEIRDIPPEVLARLINKTASDALREESYDKVITSYIRRSSESLFSGKDLKRLLDFINGLRPELKKQFLSSTVRTVSKDMDSAYKALDGVSVDEIMELLNTINEQKMVIPDALKNLLDKLSDLRNIGPENVTIGDTMLVDDIFLSPDLVNLLGEGDFKSSIDTTYQKEIKKLLEFKSVSSAAELKEIEKEYSDDYIEKDFQQTILELLLSDIITEEEYQSFITTIKEQTDQLTWSGQYSQILKILQVLSANANRNRFPDITAEAIRYYYSQEFIANLIESFKILGRQMREEAYTLCEYYGERIIAPLIDALIQEDSQIIRKFFVSLLKQLGDGVIPEAVRRLGDSRWFVKRNMLYLLGECNREEVLPHIRPYARHENRKVSFEAVKCLLNSMDGYGLEAVKDNLSSESRESVEQGIALAGAYRIKKVVPDLIQLLKKRRIGGTDAYEKIPIVKALGEIGDPRALDALREVLSGKSLFFKGVTEKLKEEIYRTLRNYPYSAIRDFIEAGMKSKSEYIREESLRLSRTKAD